MNTQANAIPQLSIQPPVSEPASLSETRLFYWSVRRELWENRSIYIAPLAVAAVTLFGFLVATMGRAFSTTNLAQRRAVLEEPGNFAAFLVMGTAFVVGVFYSLDALHGERRDRSLLFWKSLPVSDVTTVLSKASIPIVVIPLLSFGIIVAMQWIMLLLSTAALLVSGLSVSTLWTHMPLFQMWLMLLYHLITIHVFWYAPIYGWLLLVSAWARRAVFLWAALPLLAIGIVEKMAFNTSFFAAMLGNRLGGGVEGASFTASSASMDPLMHINPARFLISPGLWIGLVVAAAFLATAVWLRRNQGPI